MQSRQSDGPARDAPSASQAWDGTQPALAGRAVLVTGGARGLGRAFAFAAARAGARVAVNGRSRESVAAVVEELRATGADAVGVDGSVAVWSDAERIVGATIARFGRLDGLVNNAGVFHSGLGGDDRPEELRASVEVNLLGAMHCGTLALQAMREQGSGAIVNVTSDAQQGFVGMGAYGAAKAGVTALTYAWAREHAGTGIRVNAVAPVAATEMTSRWDGLGADATPESPDRVAPLVVELLREDAPSGLVLRCDGTEITLLRPARYRVAQSVPLEGDASVSAALRAIVDRVPAARRSPARE